MKSVILVLITAIVFGLGLVGTTFSKRHHLTVQNMIDAAIPRR